MSLGRDLLGLVAVCAAPLAALAVGARGPVAASLDLGPNDHSYLSGFDPFAEIAPDGATRWSGSHARIDLPLTVSGPATVSYRVARMLPETAVVRVGLASLPVDTFTARGGAWHVRQAVTDAGRRPSVLTFDIDSHDRRGLGLRFDWVRVEAAPGGRLRLRGAARWWPLVLVAGLFAALRIGGFAVPAAGSMAGAVGLVAAAWAVRDPMTLAHLGARLAPAAAGLALIAAVLVRGRPGGRWAVAAFLAGYLVKGAGVFHPRAFYPDVQNAQRYVFALAETPGPLPSRNVAAQRAINAGYPRFIAGKAYAMPYSPLFFMPFTLLPRDPGLVQDALRHAGLAAAAAEVLLVFWLGRLLFGPAAAGAAAWVAAILPPMHSRLLLAMYATAFGHLWDTLAIVAALLYLTRPGEPRRLFHLAGSSLAALLSYVSSLFNVCGFLGALALFERRRAPALLAVAVGGSVLTVFLLYGDFLTALLGEILPALWRGGAIPTGAGSDPTTAFSRIVLFYGWGFPALAVIGLVLARRRVSRPAFHLLSAYALTFVLLVTLRALGGGVFKDLKEISFVGPLVAVLGGLTLAESWSQGRNGRVTVLLLAAGLIAFSAERYAFYLRTYASPIMTAPLSGRAGSGTFLSGHTR